MNQPLISVIVPVYRVENYLERCVDSILGQTYENLEVWLVDDGSPDRCGELCDAYAEKDSRVRVIHKENGGQSSARNAALDVCTGAYITFVDSDDTISPDMCQRMLERLQEVDADMAVGGIWYADEEGNLTPEPMADRLKNETFGPEEGFRRMTEAQDTYSSIVCSKLYRKELFEGLRFAEGRIHEDEMIMHHLCGRCERIVTMAVPFYYYLVRANSTMTTTFHIKRVEDGFAAYWDRYLYLKERGYDRYARVSLHFCCGLLNVGLTKLPLKGNEAVFYPKMKLMLRHNAGLRCIKMLLLVAKNKLTFR